MRRSCLLLLLSLAPAAGFAQELERILLPVAARDFRGAYDSYWVTRFTVYNDLGRTLVQNADLGPFGDCFIPPCDELPAVKNRTAFDPLLYRPDIAWKPGVVLYAPSEVLDRVHFSLRVQDTSRQALTWGTEIPVIREANLLTANAVLLNVPLGDRFRQTLRVYEIDDDSAVCRRVQVRAFDQVTGETLGSRDLELTSPDGGSCVPEAAPFYPNAAELHGLLQLIPSSSPRDVIGVELIPLTPGFRYWGFVSITNNETQHVTVITPQ